MNVNTCFNSSQVRSLEKDLKLQSEVSERLQKEVEDLKSQLSKEKAAAAAAAKAKSVDSKLSTIAETSSVKKKPPMLGKSSSGEVNAYRCCFCSKQIITL